MLCPAKMFRRALTRLDLDVNVIGRYYDDIPKLTIICKGGWIDVRRVCDHRRDVQRRDELTQAIDELTQLLKSGEAELPSSAAPKAAE